MRQAAPTVAVYLHDAVKLIDTEFGDGYARLNPQLVGAFIQAAATDYLATTTEAAADDIASAIALLHNEGMHLTVELGNDSSAFRVASE